MVTRKTAQTPEEVEDALLDKSREECQMAPGWKPTDEGQKIRGVFVKAEHIKSTDRNGKERSPLVFTLQTETGPVTVWGSANLEPQMKRAMDAGLRKGQMVVVVYDGKATTSGGFKVKLYALAVIPE